MNVCNASNTTIGSHTNFGYSYELPQGYTFGSQDAKNYLSGNFNQALSVEIEVYQINKN